MRGLMLLSPLLFRAGTLFKSSSTSKRFDDVLFRDDVSFKFNSHSRSELVPVSYCRNRQSVTLGAIGGDAYLSVSRGFSKHDGFFSYRRTALSAKFNNENDGETPDLLRFVTRFLTFNSKSLTDNASFVKGSHFPYYPLHYVDSLLVSSDEDISFKSLSQKDKDTYPLSLSFKYHRQSFEDNNLFKSLAPHSLIIALENFYQTFESIMVDFNQHRLLNQFQFCYHDFKSRDGSDYYEIMQEDAISLLQQIDINALNTIEKEDLTTTILGFWASVMHDFISDQKDAINFNFIYDSKDKLFELGRASIDLNIKIVSVVESFIAITQDGMNFCEKQYNIDRCRGHDDQYLWLPIFVSFDSYHKEFKRILASLLD